MRSLKIDMLKEIIKLRHRLHQNPEVSNNEFETSERITNFIQKFMPDEIISLSKTGKAFVFKGKKEGKTLMFRAELDALPISENNNIDYVSKNKGVAHLCGHDGHMAIIAGLAYKISQKRPEKGKVVLLFQPAEEVEQGAKDVIKDPNFKKIEPDYIFALHNIPDVKKHKILIKKGNIAAASQGMTVKFFGKTSHAAEPENGISPANAISKIIKELHELISDKKQFNDLTLLTIIHIQLGEISFGTSPGYAEICITLRSFENKDMKLLISKAEKIIIDTAKDEKLKYEISYSEVFPAIVNNDECFNLITQSAYENNLQIKNIEKPFKWSEDFSYYTEKYKGGFFGLGSGINQPALHNPNYNFPDEIIKTGIKIFFSIYKKVNFIQTNHPL